MLSNSVSRRAVLGAASGLALTGLTPRNAGAVVNADLPVRWLTDYNSRGFITYPHHNGFFNGGANLVIRYQLVSAPYPEYLHIVNFQTGALTQIPPRAANTPVLGGYFDVHYNTGLLVCVESAVPAQGIPARIWTFNAAQFLLNGTGTWQQVYEAPANTEIADHMAGIHPDGTKIAFSVMYQAIAGSPVPGDRHCKITEVTLSTGQAEVLVERDKLLNHVHYHPEFPTWLMFSREGDINLHTERVWAHHRTFLPNGGNIVPQVLTDGTVLRLAHERACHHQDSLVVVNYASPRGLYRGFLDSRQPVRIASGRFEHCDISRDGRFIVVDTADQAMPGMSIELIDTQNGNAITSIVTGIVRGDNHPRHNHPVISPDGNYVLFNDPDPLNRNSGPLRIGVVDISGL